MYSQSIGKNLVLEISKTLSGKQSTAEKEATIFGCEQV